MTLTPSNQPHTQTHAQLISRLDSLLCNFLCTLIRVVCERKAKFISVAHLSTFICVWHLFVATFCGFAVLTFYAFLHCLVSFIPTPPSLSLFLLFFCFIFTSHSTLSFCLSPWQHPLPASSSSSSDDRRRVDLWCLFILLFGRLLACHLKSRVPGNSPDYPPLPPRSPRSIAPANFFLILFCLAFSGRI